MIYWLHQRVTRVVKVFETHFNLMKRYNKLEPPKVHSIGLHEIRSHMLLILALQSYWRLKRSSKGMQSRDPNQYSTTLVVHTNSHACTVGPFGNYNNQLIY